MINRFKRTGIIVYMMCIMNGILNAQQIPVSSQSYLNGFIHNPANIGNSEYTNAFIHSRKQWMGIQGAPETYLFSVDGPVSKNVGLGLMLYNDQTDIIGRTGGYGAYRYRFKISGDHFFGLGLSAGFMQNSIAFDKIRTDEPGETTLLANREKRTAFDANIGITYQFQRLEVGVASYQLLNNNILYENTIDFKSLKYQLIRHYVGIISYKQQLTEELRIDPQIIMRSVQGMPVQFDVSAYLNWQGLAWFGLTYKHHFGVNFSLGGIVYDKFIAGYSYSLSTGNIANYTNGSHEVVLGLRLFSKSSGNNRKKTDEEYQRYQQASQEQYEKIEKIEQENEDLKSKVKSTEQKLAQQKQEINRLKKIYERDEEGIKEAIEKYKISIDELEEVEASGKDDIKGTGTDNTQNTGKDDTHATGKGSGLNKKDYYVVLGAYYNLKDAKLYQRILEREAGLKTSVVQRDDGKYFFVYTTGYNRMPNLQKDIKRELRHINRLNIDQYINGNVWIYDANKKAAEE